MRSSPRSGCDRWPMVWTRPASPLSPGGSRSVNASSAMTSTTVFRPRGKSSAGSRANSTDASPTKPIAATQSMRRDRYHARGERRFSAEPLTTWGLRGRLGRRDRRVRGCPREPQRSSGADGVGDDEGGDSARGPRLLRHVPDDPEHKGNVRELGDPKARVPRHSPRVLAERTRAVFLQCRRELVRRPLCNDRSLERHHREAGDRRGDPAGVPRPEVRRHVRTGGEQPEDRDREGSAGLARDSSPRDRVGKRLRAAELEDAYKENRGRPDPDEEREQVQVENHVVRVQKNDPPEVGDAATRLYARSRASSRAAPRSVAPAEPTLPVKQSQAS